MAPSSVISPTSIWLALRIGLVCMGIVDGFDLGSVGTTPSTTRELIAVAALFVLAFVVTFGLNLAGLATIRFASRSFGVWKRPSWRAGFLFTQPHLFFHAIAWYFLAGGLAGAFAAMSSGGSITLPAIAAAIGLATLGSLHAFVRWAPSAFEPIANNRSS